MNSQPYPQKDLGHRRGLFVLHYLNPYYFQLAKPKLVDELSTY